jgi:hypothetical protein
MLLDAQLVLDNGSSLAIAAGSQPSSQIIDWAGVGVGQAPPNYFGVQSSVFGQDVGPGDGVSPPKVVVIVGTAFVGATGTLQIAMQESVDSSTPGYTPSAWQTIAQTEAIPVAALVAGAQAMSMAIPQRNPGQGLPRFFRLNYTVAVATFTAGTVSAFILTGVDAVANTIYPANY